MREERGDCANVRRVPRGGAGTAVAPTSSVVPSISDRALRPILVIGAVVLPASIASAGVASTTEPPPPPPAPETNPAPPAAPVPPRRDHTAAEVLGAPLPGDESGRIDETDEGDGLGRRTARAALFLPKLAFIVVTAPIRGFMWAEDRYQLEDLYYRVFYNRDRTIGLYPTAAYTSGFGLSAGAGFVAKDLLGAHESIALQATTGIVVGETYRESASASLRSGDRLGDRFTLGVDANFDRRPSDPFDGIGNGDLRATAPGMPIDPRTDETAVATHLRYQEARVAASADARPIDHVEAIASGELTDLQFATSTSDPSIDQVYDPMGLVGWNGVRHLYGQLELRIDTRGPSTKWEPRVLHTSGSLLAAYVGRIDQLGGAPDFWRYGVELQQMVRLARGPRFLALRLRGDAVTGTLDQVPFTELPTLGGGQFLRGYDFERFRDRVAVVGTVQYEWDLARHADAYLFVDAGRVYDSLDALSVDRMRVGYGVGVTLHSDTAGFLVEGAIASSIDGGIFVSASFNPGFDAQPRWR